MAVKIHPRIKNHCPAVYRGISARAALGVRGGQVTGSFYTYFGRALERCEWRAAGEQRVRTGRTCRDWKLARMQVQDMRKCGGGDCHEAEDVDDSGSTDVLDEGSHLYMKIYGVHLLELYTQQGKEMDTRYLSFLNHDV